MDRPLLVTAENMVKAVAHAAEFIVDVKNGSARIAEDRIDALIGQRAQQDLGARQRFGPVQLGRLGIHRAISVHRGPRKSLRVPGKEKGPRGPFW